MLLSLESKMKSRRLQHRKMPDACVSLLSFDDIADGGECVFMKTVTDTEILSTISGMVLAIWHNLLRIF